MLNLEEDDASDITLCKICEEVKKFSEKMIVKQTDALSIQFDYDSSQLTSEQKWAIFMRYFTMHLKDNSLQSLQYYKNRLQCLSIAETAWSKIVSYLKADHLKCSYIDLKNLIQQLCKLKLFINFELLKYHHCQMLWMKSLLHKKAYSIEASKPN